MIVYREMSRPGLTRQLIDQLIDLAAQSGRVVPAHDDVVDILIRAGELEAAVADAISDAPPCLDECLRSITERAGLAVLSSWRDDSRATRLHLYETLHPLLALRRWPLPTRVTIRSPEGYTHYGVLPESYAAAAERFIAAKHPAAVITIGIRSIGTSLSAVVAAVAAVHGCHARSITVRPHGHPFDREVTLPPILTADLHRLHDAHVAIVDEGPGMSGSSMTCVADALAAVGVADDRIALFPSWDAPGADFVNEHARAVWQRHAKYPAEFETAFVGSGRLGSNLIDISGGQWRNAVREPNAPSVPQHERRKFLVPSGGNEARLLKFAGLGEYGRAKLERAQRLADAGFSLPPHHIVHGFVEQSWLRRSSLMATGFDDEDLARFAGYLAFVARTFEAHESTDVDALVRMIATNIDEAFAPHVGDPLRRLLDDSVAQFEAPATKLDGRMMPSEWLRADEGAIKIDALDHHADHFFPGCQNIAWDVAGTAVEFELDANATRRLVAETMRVAGDAQLPVRMPAYALAYLAFRLGYADTAAAMVAGPDQARFANMAQRYRTLILALPQAA